MAKDKSGDKPSRGGRGYVPKEPKGQQDATRLRKEPKVPDRSNPQVTGHSTHSATCGECGACATCGESHKSDCSSA